MIKIIIGLVVVALLAVLWSCCAINRGLDDTIQPYIDKW